MKRKRERKSVATFQPTLAPLAFLEQGRKNPFPLFPPSRSAKLGHFSPFSPSSSLATRLALPRALAAFSIFNFTFRGEVQLSLSTSRRARKLSNASQASRLRDFSLHSPLSISVTYSQLALLYMFASHKASDHSSARDLQWPPPCDFPIFVVFALEIWFLPRFAIFSSHAEPSENLDCTSFSSPLVAFANFSLCNKLRCSRLLHRGVKTVPRTLDSQLNDKARRERESAHERRREAE